MIGQKVTILVILSLICLAAASPDPAYVCSACVIVLGLVEQAAIQIHLKTFLVEKCNEEKACLLGVDVLLKKLLEKLPPDDICKSLAVCPDQCTLYTEWPVKLPEEPPEWPTQRRQLTNNDEARTLLPVKKLLIDAMAKDLEKNEKVQLTMLPQVAVAAARFLATIKSELPTEPSVGYDSCGHNVTCHIEALVKHMPLADSDGDRFGNSEVEELRGTDWRGADCDDKRNDVYPGRLVNNYDNTVDHDCNGIFGANSTGSYEDLFCKDYPGRGLILLGDSATAHFHIPPQWITAQGWNLNGLVPVLANEFDFPQCSWGSGHVAPESCPYQYPIDGLNGIYSLYSQMLDRNRCNRNDYQNIGVNGAKVVTSEGLVDALARQPTVDKPVTVWLSLIGNDVCNGHPGFDHMSDPDEFYAKAMESLTRIDKMVPSGSHVIAMALFDGELLYDIMHNQQHPVGSNYRDLYEFMNCLEENPCWGWLNANATNRRLTTQHSNSLNRMYRAIQKTAKFENFEFLFFAPNWLTLFSEYNGKYSDLVEPTDGFHPSQTGNALLAKKIWEWLEAEHPAALGPANPYNAEIDAFLSSDSLQITNKGHLRQMY